LPPLRGERPLSLEGRTDRGVRGIEHGQQPVAGGLDDDATAAPHSRSQQAIVRLERGGHRLELILPEAGAAPDVGEQERARDRGLIDHVELWICG
jgi:hypothetical protein